MPKLAWRLKDKESCTGCPFLGREYFWAYTFTCFKGFKMKQQDDGRLSTPPSACAPTKDWVGKNRPKKCIDKLGS